MLDRQTALRSILGDVSDHLVVTGLGNAANDLAALSGDSPSVFTMDGAMGAAVSMGLGLALARPERSVVVVTGDGELLMNLGSLATVAVQRPPNLTIICLDNGAYGLTGDQDTHTANGVVDLAGIATASGISEVVTITDGEGLAGLSPIGASGSTRFVLVKVARGNTPYPGLERNGDHLRVRFRAAVEQGLEVSR